MNRYKQHFSKWQPFYFLILFGVAFLVPELIGVFSPATGDTASETWWAIFGTNDPTAPEWLRILGAVVAFGLCGWLAGHFAFGWWGGPNKKDPITVIASDWFNDDHATPKVRTPELEELAYVVDDILSSWEHPSTSDGERRDLVGRLNAVTAQVHQIAPVAEDKPNWSDPGKSVH